ncbi:hypothetical protein ABIB48_000314 [Arthrobacter sp. UYCu511]|uniref:HNH endonuclease signature motif containing protein n=1 Tax=Arthrobacter sp. UYCu511 TaxID=3156337 RepID=UPI003391B8A9
MDTARGNPVNPGSLSGALRVGDHVHQLLNLAHALSTTTEPIGANTVGEPAPSVHPDAGLDASPVLGREVSVGLDLGVFTDVECVRWAQDLEQLLRFGQALAVQAAGELNERVHAGRYAETGARGGTNLLVQSLQLSTSEANRRIRLAKEVLPITDTITGATAPTAYTGLATAFFNGSLSQERALTVAHYLDEASRLAKNARISTEEATEVEEALVSTAQLQGPDFIRAVGNQIMSHLDPDGNKPSTSDLIAKQGLFFRQPRRGLVSLYGACTIEQYEQLFALISFATNPNKHTNPNTINTNDPDQEDGTGGTAGTNTSGGTDTSRNPECTGQSSLLEQLRDLSAQFTTPNPPEPEPPEPPELSDPPTLTKTTEPEPARVTPPPLGNGWRRKLEPGEIPPRPPQAPENAIAPVFDGDTWFWFAPAATEHPVQAADPVTTASTDNAVDAGAAVAAAKTADPVNAANAADPADPVDAEETVPWPHQLYGINVPAPGSNEPFEGLDSIDPNSTDPAVKDTRTYGQKLLDGLISCVKLAARTGKLPLNGGLKTQLILSCTEAELRNNTATGTGTIYTTHSGPMPLNLFAQTLCDPEITTITYSTGQNIINLGRTQRLFTPTQRKALYARDLGCTFPDCTSPATWCEAHHITPWQDGGPTDLNNATLLCQHHHTLLHHSQWQLQLINGTPWYTPPFTIDPTQTKRRNNYHHGLPKNTN